MSTTQTSPQPAPSSDTAPVDIKLEVVVIPVSDVDRAKAFYGDLGWRLDADFSAGDAWRVVQLTPPGSPSSVMFGKGLTSVSPGSAQGMFLVVDDVEAARAQLVAGGANVSEVFHFEHDLLHVTGTNGRLAGPHPERRSYGSWASFSDPDGNGWVMQEVGARLPGRGLGSLNVATLTELLRETEQRHGDYEPTAPKHHWSTWYAAYMVARQRGKGSEEAARIAAHEVEESRR